MQVPENLDLAISELINDRMKIKDLDTIKALEKSENERTIRRSLETENMRQRVQLFLASRADWPLEKLSKSFPDDQTKAEITSIQLASPEQFQLWHEERLQFQHERFMMELQAISNSTQQSAPQGSY